MEERKIEIPEWVVRKALSVLRQNYNAIDEQCCLKRQTASAFNYLNIYLRGNVMDEEIRQIAVGYIDGNLKMSRCIYDSDIDPERCKFCSAWCSHRPSDVTISTNSVGTNYKEP